MFKKQISPQEVRALSAAETLAHYSRVKAGLSTSSTLVRNPQSTKNTNDFNTEFIVENADVIDSVFSAHPNHVGVMNFASAIVPGGNFEKGVQAQEQTLCRNSFLGPELVKFKDTYYAENKADNRGGRYTNDLIYSQRVAFVKRTIDGKETFVDPVYADVVTIAAPNRNIDGEGLVERDYTRALAEKIRNTLRAFKANGCTVLVLGAFGCGVFRNEPKVVAQLFKLILNTKEFKGQFEKVSFTIFGTGDNFNAFKELF